MGFIDDWRHGPELVASHFTAMLLQNPATVGTLAFVARRASLIAQLADAAIHLNYARPGHLDSTTLAVLDQLSNPLIEAGTEWLNDIQGSFEDYDLSKVVETSLGGPVIEAEAAEIRNKQEQQEAERLKTEKEHDADGQMIRELHEAERLELERAHQADLEELQKEIQELRDQRVPGADDPEHDRVAREFDELAESETQRELDRQQAERAAQEERQREELAQQDERERAELAEQTELEKSDIEALTEKQLAEHEQRLAEERERQRQLELERQRQLELERQRALSLGDL